MTVAELRSQPQDSESPSTRDADSEALRQRSSEHDGRKVRTPQGMVVGNAHPSGEKLDAGKCHRK
jgi:hypothetical protein